MTTLIQITLCVNTRARTFRVTSFQVNVATHEHRCDEWADVSLSYLRPFETFLMSRGYERHGDEGLRWYQRVVGTTKLAAGEG